ncbi:MFS transporter [Polynucleobacter sp. SHI8]|uniref:Bug family tripartite tricarboxylate transporter substrate binding protein n=1 Tax=unclassified Polynucleobacter TaxID=2640945 RepID=UPI00249387C0|nr:MULTISPECIES: tripartite tricarboxylate transporter substrate binding protein [unclassified Polynucleobacter]BDW10302.1 MFS transporter [Polynucleobacter sp. SHI2]BDW12748.1 MFS transporter [Polynucleobacter sp. SHI8]
MKKLAIQVVFASIGLVVASSSFAQSNTIKMLVAFPPGGPVDFVARTIAEPLGKELGAQIIIDNKPGGNGSISAEYMMNAPADGKVLWFTSAGAVAINPGLYEKLSYNPLRDFAPISLVVNNVEVLVVNPNNPANTGGEFVAISKQKEVTMASSGTGSVPHLAMEQLADSTKGKLLHIPYKGAAPAITDVLGGHVDGFFGDIPGLIGYIKSGKLKPIGIAAPKRSPALPDVKTFAEMGVPGVDSNNWYALFAKAGTSKAEIDRINAAVKKVLAQEDIKNRLLQSGADPVGSSADELGTIVKNDINKWTKLIKAKNIKPE